MSFYKQFSEHDRVVSSRPLYESVSMVSGASPNQWTTSSAYPDNFVQFATGTGADAMHYFDVTFGLHTGSFDTISADQKLQYSIYNQYAKMLLGHDADNNIKQFSAAEGTTLTTNPSYLPYAFLFNISRSEAKDRINYNSFNMRLVVSSSNNETGSIVINDESSNINAGADGHHYGILSAKSTDAGLLSSSAPGTASVGYIFYEAGIVVLSPYVFGLYNTNQDITGSSTVMNNICGILSTGKGSFAADLGSKLLSSATTIKNYAEFLRTKIASISFYSTTELNSTIYFCRAFNHEFNYSSNPTYIKDGEIIVKAGDPEEPSRTYITTVGLYSDDNQLLAVAKLSEPILKTRDNELIARVRIDW